MKPDSSEVFRAAAQHLLSKAPYGGKKEAAARAGVDYSHLINILAGRRYGSEEVRRQIAAALGYPGRQYEDFLDIGRRLLGRTDSAPESNAVLLPGPLRRIPIFDAGAGEPSSFSDSGYPAGIAEDYLDLPHTLHLGPNVFAVKVHGDSMSPDIEVGDIVMVDPARALSNGDICFATWSDDDCGDRLVKMFHQEAGGQVMLLSKNPKHGPILLNKNDQAVRLFRVVGHYKKY